MVLSNKKLKQKLRSLLALSFDTSDSAGGSAHDKEAIAKELSSLKEALSNSRSQRTRPSRKRNKKKEVSNEGNCETHEGEEEDEKEGDGGEKNRKKKKKREESESVTEGEEEKGSSKKSKKNKNKRKEKKKKRRMEKKTDDSLREGEEETAEKLGAPEREESGVAAKKVYVGGIPYYSTKEDIISFFDGCGTVTDVDCMKFPESGKFRGISILTFKTDAAARRALALDGGDMGGFYLKIQPFKPARSPPKVKRAAADFAPKIIEGYNRVYVGNLSWEITEDELRSFFSGCNISSIRFGEDKTTGEFKGYAHVDFSDEESLTRALKLEQKMVCGRPARIQRAVPSNNPGSRNAPDAGRESQVEGKEVLETNDAAAEGKKKNKRRRCYNCGAPGHLSSACLSTKKE